MDAAQVLTFSAAHCIPFQPSLACVTNKKQWLLMMFL
jgi:hypothetical protein